MARLYLVRHGQAAAKFDADRDPGLDEVGRRQAEEAASKLATLGPIPILASPLRRARETAAPLERLWHAQARIEPGIGEMSSPVDDLKARGEWLRRIAPLAWSEVEQKLGTWRAQVVATLAAIPQDSVLFTHFIPINVIVGHVRGDDRIVCFQPDNGLCTVVEFIGGRPRIVEAGAEAPTRVL